VGQRATFRVELLRPSDEVAVVEASGELDFFTGSEFSACLASAIGSGAGRVVVDLTQVTFIDSSALGTLIGAARQSAQQTNELMIVCPPGNVARIIAISGLSRVFAIYATREEALGTERNGPAR
jgi:anti-sigma B factor antagonist